MLETIHTYIYIYISYIHIYIYIYIHNQQNTFLEGLIQTPYFSLVDLGLIFKLFANSSQNLQTISNNGYNSMFVLFCNQIQSNDLYRNLWCIIRGLLACIQEHCCHSGHGRTS